MFVWFGYAGRDSSGVVSSWQILLLFVVIESFSTIYFDKEAVINSGLAFIEMPSFSYLI